MTREEAKANAICIANTECTEECEKAQDMNIDIIYDYFESRICINCKSWEDEGDNNGYCEKLNTFSEDTFGCNEYKSKQ